MKINTFSYLRLSMCRYIKMKIVTYLFQVVRDIRGQEECVTSRMVQVDSKVPTAFILRSCAKSGV